MQRPAVNRGGQWRNDRKTELVSARENGRRWIHSGRLMKNKSKSHKSESGQRFAVRTGERPSASSERCSKRSLLTEAEQRLHTILDYAPDAIVMLDAESGQFLDANVQAERLFGLTRESLLELGLFELSPPTQPCGQSSKTLGREKFLEAVNGSDSVFEWWCRNARGERFPCDVHLVRMPYRNHVVIRGSVVETSGKKLLELSEVGRGKILEEIACEATLANTLEQLVLTIENLLPGLTCSILLLDHETNCLRTGAGPSLPDFYNAAIDGLKIGPKVGSCGAAAFTGKRVIVSDVTNHPNWAAFRPLAEQAKLKACWSEPILSPRGDVLGTFAMYYDQPSEPAPVELKVIEVAAQMTAIAIERLKTQELLRETNENLRRRVTEETQHLVKVNEKLRASEHELRLAAVAFDVHDSIIITDKNGKILRVNNSFTKLTGYSPEEVVGETPRVLRSGRHDKAFYHQMWQAIGATGHWEGEVWNKRKDGREYLQRLTIACVRNAAGEITHYVANGQDLTDQKRAEAEHAEILAASSVQRALLPATSPCIPGFDFAGGVYPAECVSGDFFSYLDLGENRVGILVADVSGHGLGPGLLMSQTQANLRALAEFCSDPRELLHRLNEHCSWGTAGSFVTLFLGCIDTEARSFVYAGAGQQGFLLRADGGVEILESTGCPLGVIDEWNEPSSPATKLESGDMIVLPTDGIEEAMNPNDDLFGRETMLDVIRNHASESAADIVKRLYSAARNFAGGKPQHDDITAMVVKVL